MKHDDLKAAIREWLTIDERGNVRLRKSTNRSSAGDKVGRINKAGYVLVTVPRIRRQVYGHQVVYFLTHGVWAPDLGLEVDHENRVRNDNRPTNLRLADDGENARNNGGSGVSRYGKAHHAPRFRVQLKTERGLCGVAGFTSEDDALEFAGLARELFNDVDRARM